jgi:hypothetical protein
MRVHLGFASFSNVGPSMTGDSSVGIAMGYVLDGPGSIPGRAYFSLLHSVPTGSGAYPTSYLMGTGGDTSGA